MEKYVLFSDERSTTITVIILQIGCFMSTFLYFFLHWMK